MKQLSMSLFCLFLSFCFYACNKNKNDIIAINSSISENEITLIKKWLADQRASIGTSQIDTVIGALDWTLTNKTKYQSNNSLITVKLNLNTIAKNVANYIVGPNNKTAEYLVIVMDNSGEIQQGTIGQLTPNESLNSKQPSIIIKNVLSKESIEFNGSFTMFTLSNIFLYQLHYTNNKRVNELVVHAVGKEMSTKIKSNSLGGNIAKLKLSDIEKHATDETNCWTWYLFIFDEYGNIIDAIYLGVECDTPCALQSINPSGKIAIARVNCVANNSGGGGSSSVDMDNLCAAPSSVAKSAINAVKFIESTEEPSIDYGEEFDASTEEHPNAVKRPVITHLPLKTVWFSIIYWANFTAYFAGEIEKLEPNIGYETYSWNYLNFGSIAQTGGRIPPCTSVNWSQPVAAISITSDRKVANVKLTYTGQIQLTCLYNMQWGDPKSYFKSGRFIAGPNLN